jgi:hypothetical protein
MCLQTTPGEDYGSGHFYLAKNRTFLLCVDTRTAPKPIRTPTVACGAARKKMSQLQAGLRIYK